MIGKRALDDQRNQLVFHYVRLVGELRPKYFVFENVKGLTLGMHAKFLQELIEALVQIGYQVQLPYRVLNAADFGVPQDRQRLFLIGARNDQRIAAYPQPRVDRVTVWDAIADLPDVDKYPGLEFQDCISADWTTQSNYARRLRTELPDATDLSYPRIFDKNLLSSSLQTQHTALSKQRFLATVPGQTEPISRFKKLAPEGLCNTLRAGTDSARGAFTSPRPIHPFRPRVITVREAARLHSYPDWFRFHATKWHGFRQIGNSVPPALGRAVAAQITSALGLSPIRPEEALEPSDGGLLEFQMADACAHFGVARNVIAQRIRRSAPGQLELNLEAGHVQQ